MDERENCKDFAHSLQVVVWHHELALVVARSAQGLTAETVVVALEGTKTIKH